MFVYRNVSVATNTVNLKACTQDANVFSPYSTDCEFYRLYYQYRARQMNVFAVWPASKQLAVLHSNFVMISLKLTMETSKFRLGQVHYTHSAGKFLSLFFFLFLNVLKPWWWLKSQEETTYSSPRKSILHAPFENNNLHCK